MKIVSYKHNETPTTYRIGCMIEDSVVDLQDSYHNYLLSTNNETDAESLETLLPSDPTAFYSLGQEVINRAKEAYEYILKDANLEQFQISATDVKLGTPIPSPTKIICVGRNYVDHALEMESDVPEFPVLFAKFPNAIIGPDDDIEKTPFTNELDYEVELTAVIGKEATDVNREDAYDYIAGYTIGNDITARDLQKRTPQWLQGKSIDNSTPIGPWVVTRDDIKDPANLTVRSYVNGEKRQESNTDKFIFDIPFLIEFISHLITLQPGDLIMTGTPEGVGVAMDPPRFLEDGDVVRLEIDGIGYLENKVVDRLNN